MTTRRTDDTIAVTDSRRKLALLWYLAPVPAIVILGIHTLVGRTFEGRETELWAWFCPLVTPALTLVSGAIFGRHDPKESRNRIPVFRFRLAFATSLAYVLAVNAVVLSIPSLGFPLAALQKTGLWLCVPGGLAMTALGSFFSNSNT